MAPKMCLQVDYFKQINGFAAWVVTVLDTIHTIGQIQIRFSKIENDKIHILVKHCLNYVNLKFVKSTQLF